MSELPPPPEAAYPGPGAPGYAPAYGSYGAYGGGLRPMGQFRNLRGIGTATSVLLGLMAILSVVVAATFLSRASTVDDVIDDGGISFAEVADLDDADDAVAGAALIWVLGALPTAIVFIIWQYRHARNAELLGHTSGLSSGRAIGGWFIPLANYVLPTIQLYQSSRASDPAHVDPSRAPGMARTGQGSPLVIAWGIAFAAGNLFGVGSRQVVYPDAYEATFEGPEQGMDADRVSSIGFLVLTVAAVLGIVMITSLTRRQASRIAAVGATTYGGTAYGGYGQQPQAPPAQPGWGPQAGYGQQPGPAPGFQPPPATDFGPPPGP